MASDLTTDRRTVPDFETWESPETRIRWERGLAIVAGMVGVVITFVLLWSLIPLSAEKDAKPITGQATPNSRAQAQPAAAGDAGLQPTTAPAATQAPPPAQQGLAGVSRQFPNVRRGPAIDAQIVRNLSQGQKVDVVGRSPDNQWLQIVNPDNPRERLWVSADMLDVTGDPRTLPEVRP
ncbi:MAG: SH3 domain-containing protein [Chloroflexi bacterium]|nr:SH3 domain-containing protein [Chloroflexota bacterium]